MTVPTSPPTNIEPKKSSAMTIPANAPGFSAIRSMGTHANQATIATTESSASERDDVALLLLRERPREGDSRDHAIQVTRLEVGDP